MPWMTPSEAPKALQASECNELLDPMRANSWIFAQHSPGKFAKPNTGRATNWQCMSTGYAQLTHPSITSQGGARVIYTRIEYKLECPPSPTTSRSRTAGVTNTTRRGSEMERQLAEGPPSPRVRH